MRSALLVISFVASALGYTVTTPSQTQGWTNSGAQTLTWTRVDTDPTNFTALLTNQDRSVMPNNNQVLAALVDGTKLTIALNPPSGGWIVGAGFQVNLVQDQTDTNTIYAQSTQFNITASSSSASSTTTGVTTPTSGNAVTPITTSSTSTGTGTSTGALNPTTTPNAALSVMDANPVFVGAMALLGAFFA
jgi:hypothetical protein